VIDAAAAMKPPAAAGLLQNARDRRETAGVLIQLARRTSEAGDTDKAELYLAESQAGLVEACQVVVDGDLAERFTRESEAVKRAAAGLGDLQVKELAADDWARLEQQLAAVEAPDAKASACAQADHLLGEMGELDRAALIAKDIEKRLEQKWPELADAARSEALHAESAIAQLDLDAPAFVETVARARDALAAGDAAVKSQSFLAARDQFWKAKDAFESAVVVSTAAQAQADLRGIKQRAKDLDIRDAAIETEVAKADEHFQAARFVEANDGYQRAKRFLQIMIDEAAQSQGAREARELANRAQEEAAAAGAERSAAAELTAAEEAYRKATSAFEAKGFAAAESGYGEAARQFGAARAKAVVEMDRARKAGADARATAKEFAKSESCAAQVGDAQTACQAAHQALADGDAAVEARDASTAVAAYSRAGDEFQEARDIVADQRANEPKPPVIASRVPAAAQVSAAKGDVVRFEVQARDPNKNDTLRYAWTIDGVERPESGPKLELEPRESAAVAVRVDDGTGLDASASWVVTVKNRSPKLTLAPSGDALRIEPGKSIAFSAQASDPDGEEVAVAYYVGNAKVGDGDRYEFQGAKEGRFVVEARATDASGGVTAARRTVEVKLANEAPKLVVSPAGSRLDIDAGESVTFQATAQDPEEQPVVLAYYVDGKKASDGPSFTFKPQSEGRHVVEVRATDAAGAMTASRRTIQVARVEPVAPPPVVEPDPPKPPPTPPPIADEKEDDAPPAASGAEKQISSTMSLYKQYFESRNLGGMNGVWAMNMMDRMDLQTLFQACAAGKLEVALKLGKPALSGSQSNQATLPFTQTVKCNGGVVRNEKRIAKLILRGADEWQIRTMQTQ
jgi:hypothetical protein